MSDLRNRAAAAANGSAPASERDEPGAAEPVGLPDIEYTGAITDAEQVKVHVAFGRVMADVQSITKADKRDDTGGRYMFRGVDRVVNAVGPALRRHGLLVVPVQVYDIEYREMKTSGGKTMQEVTLKVKWMVIGPMGDTLPDLLESAGQATDTADKGTAKAVSVAQRVLFLAGLHIPTQDPDIDRGHERGERPAPKAQDYVDEILDGRTSLSRLAQVKQELLRHSIGGNMVDAGGEQVGVGSLLWRVGREREQAAKAAAGEQWPATAQPPGEPEVGA